MAIVVSMINMKGGVGKSTLTFNLAWRSAWRENLRVLAVDLDPQANLSQYFLGAQKYMDMLESGAHSIVDVFEQFSSPTKTSGSPSLLEPETAVQVLNEWDDGSLLHLVPSRLELSWTLKNPTEKAQLLPKFLADIKDAYDLILIDCAPTESILTLAAYRSSRYVFVPVRPEFLATIGLPLLARSLNEFRIMHSDQDLEMAGIIFNGLRRSNTPPEQEKSMKDVRSLATEHCWPVLDSVAHHSDSYATGSRERTPIFQTSYARDYVVHEFHKVANEFLEKVQLK
ncbi:Cobyrinic acid a,c-diamide synthase CobQ/CobB [Salinisphaera sp. PC39]|uniref:ParA family protein n=1 Tax=Salinisphaera sp. PC39 TaxID=1304156 RepID=UPI003340564F